MKSIQEDKFSFDIDRYPPDERFFDLKKPVALTTLKTGRVDKIWCQAPFSGSLILVLDPLPKPDFEKHFFKVSEIPKIIEFIKDTGRLQIALSGRVVAYEGLDHFDQIFQELNPPVFFLAPFSILADEKEIQQTKDVFITLGNIRYFDFLRKLTLSEVGTQYDFHIVLDLSSFIYTVLKLGHYAIVEDIENLMIDDPPMALSLMTICEDFITNPLINLRTNVTNFTLEEIRKSKDLPFVYQPQDIRFPCEIGKFLMKKLTYAPYGLDACKELMYHYDKYDLRKVQGSLNKAIVTNHPDVVNASADELSEILDNVWDDKEIPNRIENIEVGVPVSIAAIGGIAGALLGSAVGGAGGGAIGGATGGFLAELGFKLLEKTTEKLFTVKGEKLSERLAKLRTKSYQANVYDFEMKYKNRIVPK